MAWVWGLVLAALAGPGCVDSPCPPAYNLEQGLCRPAPQDAAAPPDAAGTADAGGGFGAPCTDDVTHAECAPPAPLCFKQPGSTTGFCSNVGCDMDPSICPSGWTCFDLSVVLAGAPFGCVKL